jgi:lipoprotein-anchoring transpeptidase ErfK/SrfK
LDFELIGVSCIRMLNDDITDLFARVDVGTQVVVMR